MKNLKLAALGLLIFLGTTAVAGETYNSEEARFKITFPAEYEKEVEKGDEMTVVSLSCTYKGMILLVSAFIYDEVIPEGDYALKVAEGIIVTADAFNSKFVKKKCVNWDAGNDAPGLQNPIKGKVPDPSGGHFKFFGNIYICMAYGIEYRITSLATTKKAYNPAIDQKFISSFKLM